MCFVDKIKSKFHQRDDSASDDSKYMNSWSKFKFRDRVRRSAVSREKNVEMLVVADHKMVEYHGRKVIQSYVLSIMNIVSTIMYN